MRTRLISAIVALPIFIIPILIGGPLLYALIIGATALGLYEFDRAFGIRNPLIYSLQVMSSLILYLVMWIGKPGFYFSAGVLLFIMLFIYYVIAYPRIKLDQVFYSLVGFYYVAVMLSHAILLRNLGHMGEIFIWLVFIISFGSDTFAYFVGRTLGKHKLARELSPKKTVEGAVGGLFGAAILSVVYAAYVGSTSLHLEFYHYIGIGLIGAIGSIFSQFGDISASAMKRVSGVKDFGKVMPGHGGLLDRIDSILFVAPLVYYALLFLSTILEF